MQITNLTIEKLNEKFKKRLEKQSYSVVMDINKHLEVTDKESGTVLCSGDIKNLGGSIDREVYLISNEIDEMLFPRLKEKHVPSNPNLVKLQWAALAVSLGVKL